MERFLHVYTRGTNRVGLDWSLRAFMGQHEVLTAPQRGWGTLKNGELLTAAEDAGFDVLLTTDKNLRYQQNLSGRKIAIVILGRNCGLTFNA